MKIHIIINIALAAVGIALKAERLPLNVGIGICQGMLPLVAYNYSAKNRERMNNTIKFSIQLGIIVSIISIALYEVFAGSIMRIFIPEQQTVLLSFCVYRRYTHTHISKLS